MTKTEEESHVRFSDETIHLIKCEQETHLFVLQMIVELIERRSSQDKTRSINIEID